MLIIITVNLVVLSLVCSYYSLAISFIFCPNDVHRSIYLGPLFGATGSFPFNPSLAQKPKVAKERIYKKRKKTQGGSVHDFSGVSKLKMTREVAMKEALSEFMARTQMYPQKRKLPTPAKDGSISYNALLYLKGLPYEATERDVFAWLKDYHVVSVVLIKNEDGYFTGDAYVRFIDVDTRDEVLNDMNNKTLGLRYINLYKITENAYIEYYNVGFRKEPSKRNYMAPSDLVVGFRTNYFEPRDVDGLKTGDKVRGVITEIYRNGVILDCNIYEIINGVKEKVFCVLKKNRVAKNIGIKGQQEHWLKDKELVLFLGLKINLFVEKIRHTDALSTFDSDIWREHFLNEKYHINTSADVSCPLEVSSAESNASWGSARDGVITGDANIEGGELHLGGEFNGLEGQNEPDTPLCPVFMRRLVYLTMDSSITDEKVRWWENKLLSSFGGYYDAGSAVDSSKANYLSNKASVLSDDQVDVGNLVVGRMRVSGNMKLDGKVPGVSKEESPGKITFVGGTSPDTGAKALDGGDVPSFENLQLEFFGTEADERVKFHDFDRDLSELESDEDGEHNFTSFSSLPFSSSHISFIRLPLKGLTLRESDVPQLNDTQIRRLLEILNSNPSDSAPDNRNLLLKIINEQRVQESPIELIQRGLYKLKQNEEEMKKIIILMKHLTKRKFNLDDLDNATNDELTELTEEALYKFSEWDPPKDVKEQFIETYSHLLHPRHRYTHDNHIDITWSTLKWTIITNIYGEQGDINDIINELNNEQINTEHTECDGVSQ